MPHHGLFTRDTCMSGCNQGPVFQLSMHTKEWRTESVKRLSSQINTQNVAADILHCLYEINQVSNTKVYSKSIASNQHIEIVFAMHVIAKLDARFLMSLILVTEPYVIH